MSLSQPSDEAIRASFVDTWHVSLVEAALLILGAVSVVAFVALVFLPGERLVSAVLLFCSLAVGAHWINHILLSDRVEGLTGMTLGGFYGLF